MILGKCEVEHRKLTHDAPFSPCQKHGVWLLESLAATPVGRLATILCQAGSALIWSAVLPWKRLHLRGHWVEGRPVSRWPMRQMMIVARDLAEGNEIVVIELQMGMQMEGRM